MVKRILALSLLMVGLAGCGSGDGGDSGPAAQELNNASCTPARDAENAAYLAGGWASDAFQAARTLYQNCIDNLPAGPRNSPECVSARAANDVVQDALFGVPVYFYGTAIKYRLAAHQAAADNAAAEVDRSCYYSDEYREAGM